MVRKTTILVPDSLWRKLKSIAALEGKTLSELLIQVFEQYIQQYEEKEKKEVRT